MSGLQPVMKDDEPPQITRYDQYHAAGGAAATEPCRSARAHYRLAPRQRMPLHRAGATAVRGHAGYTMGNRTCVAVNVRDDSDLHRSMPASSCEPVLLEKDGSLHVFTRLDQRHYRRIARQVCGVPCIRLPLVAGYPFGCLASSLQDIVPGEGQAWLLSILYGDG